MAEIVAADHLDLEIYPIDRPDGPIYQRMLSAVHAALADKGCAVLPGLVRSDCVAALGRCKQIYGRLLPVHFERFAQRADALLD